MKPELIDNRRDQYRTKSARRSRWHPHTSLAFVPILISLLHVSGTHAAANAPPTKASSPKAMYCTTRGNDKWYKDCQTPSDKPFCMGGPCREIPPRKCELGQLKKELGLSSCGSTDSPTVNAKPIDAYVKLNKFNCRVRKRDFDVPFDAVLCDLEKITGDRDREIQPRWFNACATENEFLVLRTTLLERRPHPIDVWHELKRNGCRIGSEDDTAGAKDFASMSPCATLAQLDWDPSRRVVTATFDGRESFFRTVSSADQKIDCNHAAIPSGPDELCNLLNTARDGRIVVGCTKNLLSPVQAEIESVADRTSWGSVQISKISVDSRFPPRETTGTPTTTILVGSGALAAALALFGKWLLSRASPLRQVVFTTNEDSAGDTSDVVVTSIPDARFGEPRQPEESPLTPGPNPKRTQ